jgi:EAL domain-containing protein (putative c-di-GMP-specific phosphodiesterase class I)
VASLLSDKESATIVGALVGLGRALGLKITAEGVEDRATADALHAMGCELAQGFLFGHARQAPVFQAGLRAAAKAAAAVPASVSR